DPNIGDVNDFIVFVWGEGPDESFFWPYKKTPGVTSPWYFDTADMSPCSGAGCYYVNVDVMDWYSLEIVQQGCEQFTIEKEVDLVIREIDPGRRYVRLGDDPCIAPVVKIESRSNEDVDVGLLAELYEPNDPNDPNTQIPVCTWTRDKITLQPGEPCDVRLEDCNGFNTAGTHDLRVTISNCDGNETADHNETFPVIPALGLDVSKTLDPEFVSPTEYTRAEVSITLESPGLTIGGQPVVVVLIIDASSSMNDPAYYNDPSGLSKLDYAKDAAENFAHELLSGNELHLIGVVGYADTAGVPPPLTDSRPVTRDYDLAAEAIGNVASCDLCGTSIAAGITKATNILRVASAGHRRAAILLSDGHVEEEDVNSVECAADDANDYGITIMTVALGSRADVDLLGTIATKTGGIAWGTSDAGDLVDVYEAIYEDIVSIGVEDVTVTDWVSYDPNRTVLDVGTIRPPPVSAAPTVDGNEYVISWELPALENTERLVLRYEVELYDLAPGEIRPVNNSLEVTGYDSQSGKQVTVEIGEQTVKVSGATGLTIRADDERYDCGELAELTTSFEAPDALRHVIVGSAEHFGGGEVNDVDVNSSPGSVTLVKNTDNHQYNETGTLNLIIDAGGGAYWGDIDFSGWYPGQYELFDKINNYVRSNVVTDVHFYQRQTQGNTWWEDCNDSWYGEVNDAVVGNALVTDEGWIAYVSLTGPLDSKLVSSDFMIEGWISTDANGVLFYRGDDTDANYLSIYAYDDGVSEKLYVDCNIAGFDRDFKSVELTLDGNDWHYVALAVADGNAALYIDGNEPNGNWAYEMNVMSELEGMPIVFGGDLHPTLLTGYRTYPCRVDEVRIYDRALEPNDIWDSYAQGRDYHLPSEVRKGLVGYWDFGPGPEDQSDLGLGGMFVEAYVDGADPYDLRRVTGRSSEPNFPQKSYVMASSQSIDIIDAEDNALWMRFPTDRRSLWLEQDVAPSCLYAHDGKVYVGQDAGGVGLGIIDFAKDEIRNILPEVLDGLSAHWKLNESSGTTASDSSGNNHSGYLNGFTFDNNSVTGIMDGALNFDGADDYVNCPSISFEANEQYTYSVWLRANGIDQDSYPCIISDEDSLSITGFKLSWNNGKIELCPGPAASTLSELSNDGTTWHHVAFTYRGNPGGGAGTLYLDGIAESSYFEKPFSDSGGNFKMGAWEYYNFYFKGTIDDVRIYDRVLSGDEIRRLYGRGNKSPNATIGNRFLTEDSNSWPFVDELILRDGHVHDVMAARIGEANCIAIGTNKGVAVIKDESDIYDSDTMAQVTRVFLTDSNDLYFVVHEVDGDSVYAVYDIENIADDFGPDAVYGWRDQNAPNLPVNEIRDLYVVSGGAGGGNNAIYVATPDGVVQIEENQGQRSAGVRKVSVSARSEEPNSSDFVPVLA
ncbi:MAG: LamG-like jellyroll fold domain-containing protein, partial [Planctomycetota bacterium]